MAAAGRRLAGVGSTTIQSLPAPLLELILAEVSRRSTGMLHAMVCREWADMAPGCARAARLRDRYDLLSLREVPGIETLSIHPEEDGLPPVEDCVPRSADVAVELKNLPGLKSLEWRSCDEIPEPVFRLSALTTLRVAGLFAEVSDAIGSLTLLEELELRCKYSLSRIPAGIGNLHSLRRLHLRCELSAIPLSIMELGSLQALELEIFPLYRRDRQATLDAVGQLTGLKELALLLWDYRMRYPESLGNLTGLRKLLLRGLPLEIPLSLSSLTNLESLRVHTYCNRGAYPEVIAELTGLRHLEVSGPLDCEAPESLSRLTCLTSLVHSTEIPDIFNALPELRILAVKDPWVYLPPTVRSLKKLRDLAVPYGLLGGICHEPGEGVEGSLDLPNLRSLTLNFAKDPTPHVLHWVCSLSSLRKLRINAGPPLDWGSDQFAGLTQFPCLMGLRNLRDLHICKHDISSLPGSLANLSSLQRLRLERLLKLREVPASIGQLEALEHLHIDKCPRIRQLPSSLGDLQKLATLVVVVQRRDCLPEHPMPALQRLPDSLGDFPALRRLELKHLTNLVALPDSFSRLTSLEVLLLHDLKVERLDPALGELRSLRHLSLNNLPVKSLPESIGNLRALVHLHLHLPFLHSLPRSMANLTSLRRLKCDDRFFYSSASSPGSPVQQLVDAGRNAAGHARLGVLWERRRFF